MKGVGIIHWNIAWLKKEFAVFPSKCFPVPAKLKGIWSSSENSNTTMQQIKAKKR